MLQWKNVALAKNDERKRGSERFVAFLSNIRINRRKPPWKSVFIGCLYAIRSSKQIYQSIGCRREQVSQIANGNIFFQQKTSVLVGPVLLIPVAIGVREVQRAMQKTNECATLVRSNSELYSLGLDLDIITGWRKYFFFF